jgi:hypothetical protein
VSNTAFGQPDRRHQIAAAELGQHPGVDPIGLAGQRCETLHLLRVGDLDLPALKLEPVVHEAGAVHRLDRGADWLAMTLEPMRQTVQSIGIGRRGTNLERRTLAVEQVEVETLATEIQTGVQHRNRASLRLSRMRGASLRGRPFFMAFLTMSEVADTLSKKTTRRHPFSPGCSKICSIPGQTGRDAKDRRRESPDVRGFLAQSHSLTNLS